MKNLSALSVISVSLLLLFLLVAPVFLSTYWIITLTEILIMSLFAMSFNLLFGYTGLLSFGQAGFFGAGGVFRRTHAATWAGVFMGGAGCRNSRVLHFVHCNWMALCQT
jgi:ABC-type branched-subunit amino acid transport system permease subunit